MPPPEAAQQRQRHWDDEECSAEHASRRALVPSPCVVLYLYWQGPCALVTERSVPALAAPGSTWQHPSAQGHKSQHACPQVPICP